jgi:hypothetical protein
MVMKKNAETKKHISTGSVTAAKAEQSLLQQRSDLSKLIYAMEHNGSFHALPWQIESLKHTLTEIEHQIVRYKSRKIKRT